MTRRRSLNVQAAAVLATALFAAPIARPYGLPALFLLRAAIHEEQRTHGRPPRYWPEWIN
jgi:hypothetical protein